MDFPKYEAILKMKESGVKNVWVMLSEQTGINKEVLRAKFNREKSQRNAYESLLDVENIEDEVEAESEPTSKIEEKYSYDSNGDISAVSSQRIIALSDEEKKSPDYVLEAHGFDPNLWVITNAINNYWGSPRPKDAGTRTLYQSKISIKPKSDKKEITQEDVSAWFSEIGMIKKLTHNGIIQKKQNGLGKMLLIPLADFHFGNKNPSSHMNDILAFVMEKFETESYDDIYIVNMGDILHVDGYSGQTTAGTQVGARGAYYDIWNEAVSSIIELIGSLKKLAPVHFSSICGNHDRVSSFTVANAVALYFNNDMDVSFDVSFEERKYFTYGSSVLGFLHGDIPAKNVSTLIQREAREMYGNSEYAYLFLGHLHHISVKDNDGVIVYQLPSPTPTDEWHEQQAYTGTWKGTQCFVIDSGYGVQEIWHIQA
jgi:hypothetical protein